jgi:hypothetical protein
VRTAAVLVLAAACVPRAAAAEAPRFPTEVGARVLDLAFTRRDRLVVLMDGALALFRVSGDGLDKLDERPLATPTVVRLPAGMLAVERGGDTAWVATNRSEGAILFSTASDRLSEVERAAALPWPGVARGLTFRAGTNLIEGEIAELGPGPFIRVGDGWAIDNQATFRVAGLSVPGRCGSAAVRLEPRRYLASGPDSPYARHDRLQFLRIGEDGTAAWEWADAIGAPGMVTALARSESGQLAAGLLAEGRPSILLLPKTRNEPQR